MFSIIIWIFIFCIQINSEDTFDCTGYEDDSFHPMLNTNDCRFYWHCIYVNTVYMRAIKRSCPAGTEFDVHLNECEWANLVNCGSIESSSSTRTTTYSKLFSSIRTEQHEVLPNNSSTIFLIEQFLKNLISIKFQSATINTMEPQFTNNNNTTFESTTTTTTTSPSPFFITSKLKRRHLIHRNNLTLNILTSKERKIRQFSIHQRHGLLIHCNEIRRRQLRDLIFRISTIKTMINSSSKIIDYDILLSLTIFLIFTRISD